MTEHDFSITRTETAKNNKEEGTRGKERKNYMNPLIVKRKTPLFVVALACFVLSSTAQALLPPPPPDGGYPNGNTAEGDNALLNLTSGSQNTALGFSALGNNTTGSRNTATGFDALVLNTGGLDNTAIGYEALFSNSTASQNTSRRLFAGE